MAIDDLLSEQWTIFPNPTAENLYIQKKTAMIFKGKMQLSDILGKVWWEEKLTLVQTSHQIPVGDIPAGFYLLKIEDESGNSSSFRILKK
jgi:hypothetical protein